MSQKEPLINQNLGELAPSAPSLPIEGQQPGAQPGQISNEDIAPPAYAPGVSSSSNGLDYVNNTQAIPQQQQQQPYQSQQYQQPSQPSQPQYVMSQPQPQGQRGYPAQVYRNAKNNNNYATIDNAAAPAANAANPNGTTVIVVPAGNGYAKMPPGPGPYPGPYRPPPAGPYGRPGPYGRGPTPPHGPYHRHPPPPRGGMDDPCCIYVFAVLSLFFPIIGLFAMCCLNCGSGMGPRRRMAFNRLVIFTIIGFIINGIWWYYGNWYAWSATTNDNN